MFDSLPTLPNCFIFPNVTINVSASTIDFARKLHYLDPEHSATADNVVQTLGKCLSKYYETLPNYDPAAITFDYSTLYSYETGQTLDVYLEPSRSVDGFGQFLVREICAGIPTSINSDVGGVGVGDSDRFFIAVRVANAWVGLRILLDPDRSCNTGVCGHSFLEMDSPQRLCLLPSSSPRMDGS